MWFEFVNCVHSQTYGALAGGDLQAQLCARHDLPNWLALTVVMFAVVGVATVARAVVRYVASRAVSVSEPVSDWEDFPWQFATSER